tara:strand:- start:1309 stop:1977 length:669 start_codon:yes stop_codon:yes gene_type:complete
VITSCTLTTYTGELINPPTVAFNKPNFRYITTISGSEAAFYHGFWLSQKSRTINGLINEAKKDMYSKHQLSPNQIITNMTRDVIRTHNSKGWGRYEVKVVLSGDIYEFYNGDPSRFKTPNITDDEQETSNLEKEVEFKTEFDISYFLKKGFSKYEDDLVLNEGAEIIFKLGSDLYKGKVEQFNQEFNLCNLVDVKKFDFKSEAFSGSGESYICLIKFIVAYK